MTIKVSELTLEDAYKFSSCEIFRKNMEFNLSIPELRRSFSFNKDGEILAILGGSWISQGVWEVWLYAGESKHKFAKSLVREVKDFTDWVITQDVHRLQMAVLEENRKWAQAIGFQFESIVKNYHSKKDHFMFTKVANHGR